MVNWFKRNKKKKTSREATKPIPISHLNSLDYHPKIIVAWAKTFEGNKDLLKWLSDNDYKELVMAYYAVRLNQESRDWLMKNGYAHLMAMINASEGNEIAQKWLLKNGFHLLYYMALAIEGEQDAWEWIGENASVDIFLLTQNIKKVKDDIEESHNDVHSFGKDT